MAVGLLTISQLRIFRIIRNIQFGQQMNDGGQGSYVVTTNEGAPIVYALNRGAMLAGATATSQRFSNIPPLTGFAFQGISAPADIDGPTAPPTMSAVPIMNHRDTEVHGPPRNPTSRLS